MRLTHVRLLVERFGECFRFYRDVIGLDVVFGDPSGDYAELSLGDDQRLALFGRAAMAEAIGAGRVRERETRDRVALVFLVRDPDREAERLRGRGVSVVAGPQDRAEWGLRTVHVRDPDGNLIELYRPLEEA